MTYNIGYNATFHIIVDTKLVLHKRAKKAKIRFLIHSIFSKDKFRQSIFEELTITSLLPCDSFSFIRGFHCNDSRRDYCSPVDDLRKLSVLAALVASGIVERVDEHALGQPAKH